MNQYLNNKLQWSKQTLLTSIDCTENMQFRISLHQQNVHVLEKLISTISDPGHEDYGKYLTAEQISQIIKQPDEQINMVFDWLKSKVDNKACPFNAELTVHKDHILVDTCIHQLYNIFSSVSFTTYQHPVYSNTFLRTTQLVETNKNHQLLNIPNHLHSIIKSIHGITDLPIVSDKKIKSYVNQNYLKSNHKKEAEHPVTPSVIRQIYNNSFENKPKTSGRQSSQGIASFEQQYYSPTDLIQFQKQNNITQNLVKVVGKNNAKFPGDESMLDIEYLAFNQIKTYDFYEDQYDIVKWVTTVANYSNAPLVLSISYGQAEFKYDNNTINAVSNEFLKLGLQGFTILAASGDDGPYPRFNCSKYSPAFPATSPYVTAVGATFFNQTTKEEESTNFSGGGFSDVFKRPQYQDEMVREYLEHIKKLNKPDNTLYNPQGRAIPDVSAFGQDFQEVLYGGNITNGGTSASTPLFASMIAQINAKRQELNKPPLGFINTALYKLKSVGFDIVKGINDNGCQLGGFSAVKGYDAVTGLGAPRYHILEEKLLNIEDLFNNNNNNHYIQ